MFNVSPVYHANWKSEADIVVNQGGTDSGKTYSIIQVLFTIATSTKPPLDDPIITVLGETVNNLKKGAYRTAKSIVGSNDELKRHIKNWNETDRTIYFKSGWIMEFISCDTEQSAKQGKRQYLFANEANGISWQIFWQMAKRTRIKTFIDYNPSAPFWAHEKLIGTNNLSNDLSANVELIISDHRHNPFLSDKEHSRTEGIKDKNLWNVYARGKTGNLIGLIYPDWQKIPDSDFPWSEQSFGGLDFGYTNDPTAGVRMVRIAESIFIHELCYEPAITPVNLHQLFNASGLKDGQPVYCEHDQDIITQLRRLKMMALPARKGAGSIKAGIAKVKEYKVFYTASSTNIEMEKNKYMWIIDPITGQPTNEPIDQFNHLMDCIRYGIYTHFYRA